MGECMHVQLTPHTAGGERTHAVLVLPDGIHLLRVVAERLDDLRSMSRPACGGASPIGDMIIYMYYGVMSHAMADHTSYMQ